jgi:hypothetical protein
MSIKKHNLKNVKEIFLCCVSSYVSLAQLAMVSSLITGLESADRRIRMQVNTHIAEVFCGWWNQDLMKDSIVTKHSP